MKTRLTRRANETGSILLVSLVTCGIIGLALLTYLTLTTAHQKSTFRSQAWNSAIPIIETGIEEALAHLINNGLTNLARDHWQLDSGFYSKRRDHGGNGAYYVAKISSANPPVIEVSGYVRLPMESSAYISRTVRVTTQSSSRFAKGMVAKGQIDLRGNNITTDSFDSTDPAYNTNGRYDAAKRKANGDVATNSGLVNSLSAGNANIYGHVSTGPGGSVSIGPNGSVGDLAWHTNGYNGIQPGYSDDDMNVSFPDVSAPYQNGLPPMGAAIGGVNYTYVLSAGNWQVNGDLALGSGNAILITGNATLYVTGNLSMSGQSYVQINTGSSLQLYVGGPSASLGGKGILNPSASASSFSYYGLPSNTSLSLGGNAAFAGTIYAPSAAFTLNGGGNNVVDFVGASVTSTVTMNGHFNFHYDEALGKTGPNSGFVITSWNEL